MIAIILPSFHRLSHSTIQILTHRPHTRSSPPSLRRRYRKPQVALLHQPIVSVRQDAHFMDVLFTAVHPRPFCVQSDMSSLHTSTTEGSIVASVNSSLFHHRGLSLKRAWNKRISQRAPFPVLIHHAPRSLYTRFIHKTKALFKLADSTPLNNLIDPLTHGMSIFSSPVGLLIYLTTGRMQSLKALATSDGKKQWRKTPLCYADGRCSL